MGKDGRNPHEAIEVTAPSDSEREGDEQDTRDPWEMLGIPEPPFLDECLAPQVDREFLRKFTRNELPEPAADIAGRLVLLFARWSAAHKEVLAEELERRAH